MHSDTLLEYNYLYIPSDTASKKTLLLLHGTGGDEYDLLELGKILDPHAHILSVRGNVLENGLNRFFERIMHNVFNTEDVKKRAKDLSDFISEAKRKHGIEDTQIIAVGFSNGANIAAALLMLYPYTLDGAVLFRGMVPLRPENKPNLSHKPVLLLSGKHDTFMNEDQVAELSALLKEYGSPLNAQWVEASHKITPYDVEIASKWLDDTFSNL
jgi:phospholipase/carboxylesterase